PRPNGADMLDPATQLFEHWLGAGHVVGIATDKTKELPILRRPDGPADRAVDERGASGPDFRRKRRFDFGTHGAHVHEKLAADLTGKQAVRAVIRGVDCGCIGKYGYDHVD